MQKLYQKSPVLFAVIWIAVYVVGVSAAEEFSRRIGVEKLFVLPVLLALSAAACRWIAANRFQQKFGLCRPIVPARRFLFYIPLALLASGNLWFGVHVNFPAPECALYILCMLCVGFLEEVIFRGFLFTAMQPQGAVSAVIVSSVTFGIGHIVNLFNGSGADLISNLCQIVSAIAFGLLFVVLFCKSGSLLPCILTHAAINALSAFSREAAMPPSAVIVQGAVMTVGALLYTCLIVKTGKA